MKELTLEITNKCNQNCPWCSSSSVLDGRHNPVRKMVGILENYQNECDTVRISGGEPTLHPDLSLIVRRAKELKYRVVLLTTGVTLYNRKELFFPQVDQYWINVVNSQSIQGAITLKSFFGAEVGMHIVMVKGNEDWLESTIRIGLRTEIPVRLLVLQRQGRGLNCKPLDLISWTGDRGCLVENKITIAHDGKVVTCSALKYGECSLR